MRYLSTRSEAVFENSLPHILQSYTPDGGFFVPERLPYYDAIALQGLKHLSFAQRLARIFALFIHELDEASIYRAAQLAFETDRFATPEIARIVDLNPYVKKEFLLELGHGPAGTYADIAYQFLPHFLDLLARERLMDKRSFLLAAVLHGEEAAALALAVEKRPEFSGKIFYAPRALSYEAQQILEAAAANEQVALDLQAVHGDFEQVRAAVDAWLCDAANAERLENLPRQVLYLGATSWFMVLVRIVCFISAYVDLINEETFPAGENCNLVLAEGDMSSTLAAWYARQMGVPFRKIICTTNRNKVLADFFTTGSYQMKREVLHTNTPSLDHGRPLQMERFLFEISGHKHAVLQDWRKELDEKGQLQLETTMFRRIQAVFASVYTDHQGVQRGLKDFYDQFDYCVDAHAALSYTAYQRYRQKSKDETRVLFVSDQHLLHHGQVVARAILDSRFKTESLTQLVPLVRETGVRIPLVFKRFLGEIDAYRAAKMASELYIEGDPESLKLLPKTVPTAEDIERAKRHAQEDEERQKQRPKNLPSDGLHWEESDFQARTVFTLEETIQSLTDLLI